MVSGRRSAEALIARAGGEVTAGLARAKGLSQFYHTTMQLSIRSRSEVND